MAIKNWLMLPEVRNFKEMDDRAITILHRNIIREKIFLKQLYTEFYGEFRQAIPQGNTKNLVELGSSGGFIKELMPHVITSDILPLTSIDLAFSAMELPFKHASIDGFFMINVLHYLNNVRRFFQEAIRCLKVHGKIVLIDQANTLWSQWVYQYVYYEAFKPSAGWEFESIGPLSSANGALPYILFFRDRTQFEEEFPLLKILKIRYHTPFRYLLSGGVSIRQLVPNVFYPVVKGIERVLSPFQKYLGMFLTVELMKEAI